MLLVMEDPGGNTDGRGDREFSWVMSGVRHPTADGQSASEYLDLGRFVWAAKAIASGRKS